MAVISWMLFSWLYREGKLNKGDNFKAASANLKEIKSEYKANKEEKSDNYIFDKWMWFGSGFYGLASLWTFAVIEIQDLFNFIFNFPGFTRLLNGEFIQIIVNFIVNQVGNLVSAFIWFNFWDDGSILLCFIVAYFGYWTGMELAKRKDLDLTRK